MLPIGKEQKCVIHYKKGKATTKANANDTPPKKKKTKRGEGEGKKKEGKTYIPSTDILKSGIRLQTEDRDDRAGK